LPARRPARLLVTAAILVLTAPLALAACSSGPALTAYPDVSDSPPPVTEGDTVYDPAPPAPALQLTDQDGQPFGLSSLQGSVVLVFFGYTHCTDVCPTTLADLRTAIGASGVPAKVVFVSVDPARDTPAVLKTYLDAYKAGFIGLTGSDAEIAAAAKAWGVGYSADPPDANGNYEVTHTAETFLVDGSGTLRNHIPFGTSTDLISSLLQTAAAG
jgi:protein SCO1